MFDNIFDTVIIGGGASGLACAIMLKQKSPKAKIVVIEQLDRVGKKLSVTGNGRCNITNKNISKENYYSHNIEKAFSILQNFNLNDTIDFFDSIGLKLCFEGNKAFPRSMQASSVVDILRFYAQTLKIEILTAVKVNSIKKTNNIFEITTEKHIISSKTAVIATGGLAGGSKLGSNGDGYKLLKKFGHKIYEQFPAIVQVKTENSITRSLKGIKTNAIVSVLHNGAVKKADFGEVLFCDYGLSGPPILQLSGHLKNGDILSLDMFYDIDLNNLTDILIKRKNIFSSLTLMDFFAGLIHKKIGQAVLKSCGFSLSSLCSDLTEKDCFKIALSLKNFNFKVTGNTGFLNAQTTSGGADLSEFNLMLMSEKCSGLFATGEVLDLHGDCGGYNLQWAWSSAYSVSSGIKILLNI